MSINDASPARAGYSQLSHPISTEVDELEAARILDEEDEVCLHKWVARNIPPLENSSMVRLMTYYELLF